MRAIRVASAALLATAALSLGAATSALADEGTGSDATPSVGARAGGAKGDPSDAGGAQADPADPVVPVDPVDPVAPVDPLDPVVPVDPLDPADPLGPVGAGASGDGVPSADGAASNVTSFGFSVTPATVAPGGSVTLKSDGCEASSVTVSSGVFDTVTLTEGRAGTATIDVEAKIAAEYQVTFDCKGEKGTAPLVIAAGSTGHSTGGRDTGAHKGVKAGFGGGAGELGVTEVVIGTALIAGALGGGGVLLTRRRGTGDLA
ncbi:hypothetical protein [Streptomyces sp. NPDC056524]|uniref:hypothetical protein n=1 Tax=Streptomyces sp. NPDC056524 TaxID=3345851 RepID=UPI0036ACC247